MSDLVGGTVCNGCGQPCGHAPGIGYFCQNDACTYEKDRARAMLQRMRPIDPRDACITELETALAEAEGRVETARNEAFEEAAKVAEAFRSPEGVPSIDYDQACDDIAHAIRTLADPLLDMPGNGKEGV